MEIYEYICAELVILVPVLSLLGVGLKKSRIADENIPLILGSVGIVLSALWMLSTRNIVNIQDFFAVIFASVTQGVLTAGASVYAHQIYKQNQKRGENDENTESTCDEK